jgi:TM2 domain-containing membrane protein YozV
VPAPAELEEAYGNWFKQGSEALDNGDFEEAANCLREAAKRSRALPDADDKELEARKKLGLALEKLGKLPEAADQYRIIGQERPEGEVRDYWLKKSQDLVASSFPYDSLFAREEFRPLQGEEAKIVPLYCAGCKRLLAEAEVYAFRRSITNEVRCWCKFDGQPVAKMDAKHQRAVDEARSTIGQRARAIQVASSGMPGGRKRMTAVILALLLGWMGGHKFYLGENIAGSLYLMWSWTSVPLILSLYEAMVLSQMSTVNFNMTYNIDLVLAQVEPPEEKAPNADVFSMEITSEESTDDASQNPAEELEAKPVSEETK